MQRLKFLTALSIVTAFLTLGTLNARANCTGSSPTWYSTPDRESVATCVTYAKNGDAIKVSPGTGIWESPVTWNAKNLTLIGAGIDQTIIVSNAEALVFGTGENPVSNSSRVTGFTFQCSVSPVYSSGRIQLSGHDWRIHANKFDCGTNYTVGVYVRGTSKTSASKGLVDNNTFVNARVLVEDYPGVSQRELNGTSHWSTPLDLGKDEAVYVEDNTFIYTLHANAVDANDAGRYVFRFNTVTDGYLEAHGVTAYRRGARKWEIYYNTIKTAARTVPFITFLRAGTGMVFNNVATGTFTSGYTVDHRRSYESPTLVGSCNGSSSWDGNTLVSGWLCRDQIGAGIDASAWSSGVAPPHQILIPAYFFLNTKNGSNGPVAINYTSGNQISANRDFYDYTTSFDGMTGVGAGPLSARPSTCRAGVGYWAKDDGEWNSLHAGPDGRFYKCSATNTWTPYYTPYTYPHPLRSEGVVALPPQPAALTVR